ncbi:phage head morphogenesis protein [Desulforegula conservatrix]|uniref:phage head morphogenesis protein n=1 Tax=Desulforegula conservatrix TaxID=153026 RepID=UPI00040CF6BB|nr:phage minor head protein [Desulforegula conservatrix]
MKFTFPADPPDEALSFFRAKELRPGFDYRDVWREEHATSFTVAKAMELDVLSDIRSAVDGAIAGGQTFREFSANLEPLLRAKGWWGRIDVPDPRTGEMVSAQLGSTRRLRTIYDANLRTAAAAGQWERILEAQDSHPYIMYMIGPSREHRPEHVSWHGLMLPVNDPFWNSHFPPSGWGCKCHARSISEHEAARLRRDGIPDMANSVPEINPETGLPTGHLRTENMPVRTTAPEIRYVEWENTRTGRIERVPEGIDPGWDTNPGAAARRVRSLEYLTQRLESANYTDAAASVSDIARSGFLESWMSDMTGNCPVGVLSERNMADIGAESRVVLLSPETMDKQIRRHPELSNDEYARIHEVLTLGYSVQDSPSSLVFILEDQNGYVTAIKSTKTGKAVFMTSFRRLSSDEVKRDEEIRRLLKKGNKKADGEAPQST